MMDLAIRVDGLGKRYRMGARREQHDALRDAIADLASRPARAVRSLLRRNPDQRVSDTFWALKDVSFEVPCGMALGIIGGNGAGKSTLLKILSRITDPTEGSAMIWGRAGSLLEVGTGFHQELTGRENIYLNGAILGMTRIEIQRKFDEIVEFAEVQPFIDTQVKHYSSGMYLRLAFAVAAHLDPQILLVDEVLAVGDAAFQKKCLGKMDEVTRQGRTVLFVSHNLAAMEAVCQTGIILKSGRVGFMGPIELATAKYIQDLQHTNEEPLIDRSDRSGTGVLRFSAISIRATHADSGRAVIGTNDPLTIDLELRCSADRSPATSTIDLALIVKDSKGQLISTFANFFTGQCVRPHFDGSIWRLSCLVESLPLLEGDYELALWCARGSELLDLVPHAYTLRVTGPPPSLSDDARKPIARKHGPLYLSHHWLERMPEHMARSETHSRQLQPSGTGD